MCKTVDTQSNLQVELKYKKPYLVPFVKYMGSKYREEIMDKTMLSKQSALKLSAQEKKTGTRNWVKASDIATFYTSRQMKLLPVILHVLVIIAMYAFL